MNTITLNNIEVATNKTESFNKIALNNTSNPTIQAEYKEFYHVENPTTTYLKYEKDSNTNNKRVSCQRPLTTESGMDIHFTINPQNIIEKCYIDFYTTKKRNNKRNSLYRLEYSDGLFKLYVITSRKNNYKKTIANYAIDGELTPGKLSAIIYRMLDIISKYTAKNAKPKVNENFSSFGLIETILYLELCLKDLIKNINLYEPLTPEVQTDLKNFLREYQNTQDSPTLN